MASASFLQTSFLGGEWSKFSQGRADDQAYRVAMNVCLNTIPIEQGAAVRRVGSRYIATTRGGKKARVISFHFKENSPYAMELTDGFVRFYAGVSPVKQTDATVVATVSAATPAVVQLKTAVTWATGDTVVFLLPDGVNTTIGEVLENRQFTITVIDSHHFTIADAVTGAAIDGSTISLDGQMMYAAKIKEYATPYKEGMLPAIRKVQSDDTVLLFHGSVSPQMVQIADDGNAQQFATITYDTAQFTDGPYLDPINGSTATPDVTKGNITLTISYQPWDTDTVYNKGDYVLSGILGYVSLVDGNIGHSPASSPTYWAVVGAGLAVGQQGFVSTDVGRHIRLFSEPALWDSATAYTAGNVVAFSNAYYRASASSTGTQPDTDPTKWDAVSGSEYARWTWGTIASVVNSNQVVVALRGKPLLYTTPVRVWRLGRYSDTTGWPTCGCYHEGRLWLGSHYGNHFDGSVSGAPLNFAPTGEDGTVADSNAISYDLEAQDANPVLWMAPTDRGIAMGTKSSEWIVSASQLSDPLTPTSIQAKRVTIYGSADIEALSVGYSAICVQKLKRKVLDLAPNVFSGRVQAKNISKHAKHLLASGLEEIAYQQELAPVIWGRCADGSLVGCTYKREENYGENDTFNGWHRHQLGSGRLVESIATGPSVDGTLDSLVMVTNDPATNIRHLEIMTDLFDEDEIIENSWFVDDAITPVRAEVKSDGSGVRLYGYWHLNGKTVSVVFGGLDLGDFAVTNGYIDVPFTTTFTLAYMQQVSTSGADFHGLAVHLNHDVTVAPPTIPPSPEVMYYQGPDTGVVGYQNNSFLIDWDLHRIYTLAWGTKDGSGDTTGGFQCFDVNTGRQLYEQRLHTLPLTTGDQLQSPMSLGNDGYIYTSGGSANYAPIFRFKKSDFSLVERFGDYGVGSGAVPTPKSMMPVTNFSNFLLTQSALTPSTFHVFSTDHMVADIMGVLSTVTAIRDELQDFSMTARSPATTPAWNSSTTYAAGDVVSANGYATLGNYVGEVGKVNWVSVAGSNTNHDPANEPTPWIAGSTYTIGDKVNQGGTIYQDGNGGLSNTPPSGAPSRWTAVGTAYWTTPPAQDFHWVKGDTATSGLTSTGDCYILTHPKTSADTKVPLCLYRFTIRTDIVINLFPIPQVTIKNSYENTLLGHIKPSDIDPAWSTFLNVGVLIRDRHDGNMIFTIDTNDSVTNKFYIVKISQADGSVIWATPVKELLTFAQTRSNHGGLVSTTETGTGPFPLYVIDTTTGTVTTQLDIVGLDGHTVGYNDATGDIVCYGSLSGGTGSPTPINGTPTTFSNKLYRLTAGPGTAFATTADEGFSVPFVAGYTYTSQGQLLRPLAPQDTGAQNGPALGKTRRLHQFAALLHQAVSGTVSFGTDFGSLRPALFKDYRGNELSKTQLFSGIHWSTIDDNYSFDGMVCWQVSRPVPLTVNSIEGFIQSQDR